MAPEMHPDIHPDIAVLAPLVGTWQGAGSGVYPTIEPFDYLETVTFGHVGKPFLSYVQRTKATDDGPPLHAEAGYLRAPSAGTLELVLAHPTGVTELAEGTVTGSHGELVVDVASVTIGLTTSAKEVTAVERTMRIVGDELHYTLRMAAVGQALQHHLEATLRRVNPG